MIAMCAVTKANQTISSTRSPALITQKNHVICRPLKHAVKHNRKLSCNKNYVDTYHLFW